jgi:hypothetical protein
LFFPYLRPSRIDTTGDRFKKKPNILGKKEKYYFFNIHENIDERRENTYKKRKQVFFKN